MQGQEAALGCMTYDILHMYTVFLKIFLLPSSYKCCPHKHCSQKSVYVEMQQTLENTEKSIVIKQPLL